MRLDGQPLGSVTNGGAAIPYDGSQFLRLSAWGGGGRRWNGELDEFDVYNRGLSQAEVLALYAAGASGKCAECALVQEGLTAWWRADGTGSDAAGTNHFVLRNLQFNNFVAHCLFLRDA